MKTQKKTLRGFITSSILALALVGGLLPANALAFAASAAGPQVNQDESIMAHDGEADANEAATENPADSASSVADPSAAPAGSEGATDNSVDENAQDTDAANTATTAQPQPQYTTTVQGHTSAELRLEGQAQPAAGAIEYGGLAYTIDPENPATAKVTGLATDKPKGDVQVQSQVASDGKLYSVTGIDLRGGGQN